MLVWIILFLPLQRIKRATCGSRAGGYRPLLWSLRMFCTYPLLIFSCTPSVKNDARAFSPDILRGTFCLRFRSWWNQLLPGSVCRRPATGSEIGCEFAPVSVVPLQRARCAPHATWRQDEPEKCVQARWRRVKKKKKESNRNEQKAAAVCLLCRQQSDDRSKLEN